MGKDKYDKLFDNAQKLYADEDTCDQTKGVLLALFGENVTALKEQWVDDEIQYCEPMIVKHKKSGFYNIVIRVNEEILFIDSCGDMQHGSLHYLKKDYKFIKYIPCDHQKFLKHFFEEYI